MVVALPLDEMSLSEKIALMEDIWLNLSHEEAQFSPPDWHERVLAERKKRIESGEIGFTDWKTAKEEIQHLLNKD